MTDRNPDDLYDTLRDRLADYGQEPPAPLWASIRAQLPPPVAAPQRRARARARRQLAAAALLLLAGVGTWGGWQLGHLPAGGNLARRAPAAVRGVGVAVASDVAAGTDMAEVENGADGVLGATPAPLPAPAGSRSGNSGVARVEPNAKNSFSTAAAVFETENNAHNTLSDSIISSNGNATAPHGIEQAGKTAAQSRIWAGAVPTARPPRTTALAAAREALAVAGPLPQSRAGMAGRHPTTQPPYPAGNAARIQAQTSPDSMKHTASGGQLPNALIASRIADSEHNALPVSTLTNYASAPNTALNADETSPAAEPPLAGQQARLALAAWPTPAPKATADTLFPLPPAVFRRWALQAVAGPALTYRRLGNRILYDALLPLNSVNGRSVTSARATQEQAALGFGAAVQMRRQLTGRWAIDTGLGYQEYATNQTVTVSTWQRNSVAMRPDSQVVSTTRLRDTYHFLTVPLRLSYQLGAGPARWRYGLLGGADVAFYLGGTTSDGIRRQRWGSSGSPYRPLSLALSLGAEVRYRLAPRWELLAQPTATFFVSSLARPASGAAVRYPLAASVLLGLSYGLR